MLKLPKLCESDNPITTLTTLQDKVWEQQLAAKQIIITGEIKEDIIEKAVVQIYNFNLIDAQAESEMKSYSRQPIMMLINSNGGVIDEAFSLISAMLSSVTPVHTFVLGKAYSSAFMITLAGSQRYAQRFSNLMFHQGSGGVIDNFAKIKDYSNYVSKLQNKIDQFVIERTKIKEKRLKEVFNTQHDWYLDSEEALKLGIIHEII